jgi:hypothetical protein
MFWLPTGVGPGVSPVTALPWLLKVDIDALPSSLLHRFSRER